MIHFNAFKGTPTLPTIDRTNTTCTTNCITIGIHDPADNRADLSANSLEFIPLSSEFINTETVST